MTHKPISAKSFKMADRGQFVDLHEPSNRNVSMSQARELLNHRWDFVRKDAEKVLESHAEGRRSAFKAYGQGHDMSVHGEGKPHGSVHD